MHAFLVHVRFHIEEPVGGIGLRRLISRLTRGNITSKFFDDELHVVHLLRPGLDRLHALQVHHERYKAIFTAAKCIGYIRTELIAFTPAMSVVQ